MKEFLIQIPNQKEAILRKMLVELGCTFIESQQESIPMEHQEIVLNRIHTEDEHAFIPWSEVKSLIKK